MYLEDLNTNGSFLDQTALEQFRKIGCNPLIKISFDGIGYHDWLRNRNGAEADALRAIRDLMRRRLLCQHGYIR